MWHFLTNLFDTSDFPPRWYCGNWTAFHGWIHIISDLLTWGAYTAIPCVILYYYYRRKSDIVFPSVYWLFGMFIFTCGTVHLVEAIIFWHPIYRISAIAKACTAIASWITVAALIKVAPEALRLPGLKVINEQLEYEIDTRKSIEADLRHSQERLQLALAASNAGAWSWNIDDDHFEGDDSLCSLFGLNSKTAKTNYKQFFSAILPSVRNKVRSGIGRAIRSGDPLEMEFQITRNAETRIIKTKGRVYHTQSDGKPCMTGVCWDITEQREQEERQKEFDEKIRQTQKLESLGVLAGGIAHDFNNILMGVLVNANILHQDISQKDPQLMETVQDIEQAALRAADLTNQMLAYAGKSKNIVDTIDINKQLHDLENLARVSIPKKAVLEFKLPPGPIYIRGDASQFTQIAFNLITNAAESIESRSGRVVVELAHRMLTADELGGCRFSYANRAGEYAELRVTDNGCGMDESLIASIFDPFFTTKFTGRGLGLSSLLGIIKSHKGAIQVESSVGEGSVFRVYLPIESAPVEKEPVRTSTFSPAKEVSPQNSILVVDDEATVRNAVKMILQRRGYLVHLAENGEEGVEQFRKHRGEIDLILLDLTMPNMSGDEALRIIRNEAPNVPIILSSGYPITKPPEDMTDPRLRFLKKPYRVQDLLDLMEELILIGGEKKDERT
ncbi:MAG: response regulator [bacterium]|nr:response regulator [bacterium]